MIPILSMFDLFLNVALCFSAPVFTGEVRSSVCVAPLSRGSSWWRRLRRWMSTFSSGAPSCGLCLY